MAGATLLAAAVRFLGLAALPPQAWVDEIWFALRARAILQTGEFPLFYKTFWGGVNPMLVYLTAAVEWLILPGSPAASRVVSATFSLLAVPLTFACLSEFWRRDLPAPRRRWLAALAALIMASFFSTVTLTRLGTEPGVALAAGLFCFWQYRRAVRTGAWLSYALVGVGAGWAQYVSPHARFIPVVLALWGLHDLILARPEARRRLLLGYGLLLAAADLTAAPLIAFFIREPEWLIGRARAVTVGAQDGLAAFWLENARRLALAFSVAGDQNARDNLAGRPLLDGLQSAGFYLGLGWAAWQARRSARARDLLLWLLIMLTPSLITDDAPSFSRLIHVAAPTAGLISLGWAWAWDALRPRLGARPARAVAVAVVAGSLVLNVYDYFGRFAAQPELAAAYTATPVRLARAMTARAAAGETVFVERVAEADEDIYAFDFLLPGTDVRRLDFRQCLPLTDRRATRTTYLIWSERDATTLPQLRQAFPDLTATVIAPEAEALVRELTLVEVPADARAPAFAHAAAVSFAPGLRLLGYELTPSVVRPGESIFLTLYWKAEAVLAEDLTAFAHIGTGLAGSPNITGRDGQPCQGLYPTYQWRPGDVVPDRFAIVIPPEAAPGDYPIAVGWYRFPSLERLALAEAAQALPDNRAVIGTLTVAAP